MITETKDNEHTLTFSTLLVVDGRSVRLTYTRLLDYFNQKPIDGKPDTRTEFEKRFLWPKEAFTNEPVPSATGPKPMWHAMYRQIVESGFEQKGAWHELRWEEELEVENHGHYLALKNSLRSHLIAIPPASPGETRYDYITNDGRYHYGCKQGEFEGIEIVTKGKYKFPFIPTDLKYTEGAPGGKKERVLEDYSEFKEGLTYYTKFQTREKFTLYKIDKLVSKTSTKITKFWGVYETSEHLGLCPIEPSNLMKHYVEPIKEIEYYIITEMMAMGLNPGDTLVPIEDSEFCEHWMEISGTKEHMLCRDQVHIECITEKNCKPIYK